jgi:hypothetical protein
MKHQLINPADVASPGAILALVSETASRALTSLVPDAADIGAALDRAYGKSGWFLYWDEDLRGQPIRGTITLAYGRETLVVG